jgi:hypothetical protein
MVAIAMDPVDEMPCEFVHDRDDRRLLFFQDFDLGMAGISADN